MIKKIIKKIIPWIDINEKIYIIYLKAHKASKKNNQLIAYYYANKIYKKYGCFIDPSAEIGRGLCLPHPIGIVIGAGARIGENCVIYQNVTIGRKYRDIAEYPNIGDNVIIYCNSVLIGDINVGKNSVIGCNSVVLKSVDENSKCVGVVK